MEDHNDDDDVADDDDDDGDDHDADEVLVAVLHLNGGLARPAFPLLSQTQLRRGHFHHLFFDISFISIYWLTFKNQ